MLVAMNMDNTDTGIMRKKKQNKKNKQNKRGYYIWHDSICLCYTTLPFFVGYYQSKEMS